MRLAINYSNWGKAPPVRSVASGSLVQSIAAVQSGVLHRLSVLQLTFCAESDAPSCSDNLASLQRCALHSHYSVLRTLDWIVTIQFAHDSGPDNVALWTPGPDQNDADFRNEYD
eukprot:3795514-Amphidinium_carterae.1